MDQSPELSAMRSTTLFKGFLVGLGISSTCILVRSCFRVAELSEGWTGPLMGHEDLFIGFEGGLIVIAVVTLNIFHPAICMRPVMLSGGGTKGFWFMKSRGERHEMVALKSRSESESGFA
jgi:hypothetical protein